MTQIKAIIKDNYNTMLLTDYLREHIKEAGFSHVNVSKVPTGTRVTLYVTKPGIVIGRKGSGIKQLTETLESDFKLKNPQLSVEEIAKPELSSSVMCNRMAGHIKRGTAFRRATMWTIQQIMENGAMGVQITVSGKLRGDRSAFEKHVAGILPRAGNYAKNIVNEDIVHVETPMGLIGIKIRIAKKEKVVSEFKAKTDTSKTIINETKIDDKKDKASTESEQLEKDSKETKIDDKKDKASTESEQLEKDSKEIQKIVTLEEEEEALK